MQDCSRCRLKEKNVVFFYSIIFLCWLEDGHHLSNGRRALTFFLLRVFVGWRGAHAQGLTRCLNEVLNEVLNGSCGYFGEGSSASLSFPSGQRTRTILQLHRTILFRGWLLAVCPVVCKVCEFVCVCVCG